MKDHSVEEAAALLGVSPQRVRAMLDSGRLQGRKVGRAWIVSDPDLSARWQRGRPLSAGNAWALLALLAGEDPHWVDAAVRSRLRQRIRQDNVVDQLKKSEPRAEIHVWRVLPGDLGKIVDESPVVHSGISAGYRELDVVPLLQHLDAYVAERDLAKLERRFRPDRNADQPNVVLRVPSQPWVLHHSERAPLPVVAADLLSSDDPRVSRSARAILESLRS
jgi:excisionase family DNA binding protein